MEEIQSFPLQWPLGWKRTLHPGESKFKRDKTIDSTCREIMHQLSLMRGSSVIVISTNIPTRKDGMPYSSYKAPVDKGAAVYFNLKGSPHVLACDKWNSIEHNLWAIAKHIESLRDQERWGVGNLEQAFAGFKALPQNTSDNYSTPWWEILGYKSSWEAINDGDYILVKYYKLAKQLHPDAGGSEEKMQELNRAKEEALKILKHGK
jgi:hypothetical protein